MDFQNQDNRFSVNQNLEEEPLTWLLMKLQISSRFLEHIHMYLLTLGLIASECLKQLVNPTGVDFKATGRKDRTDLSFPEPDRT